MSNASTTSSRSHRRQRSISTVHYNIRRREQMARPLPSPRSVRVYGQQVAGHKDTQDNVYLGLLQCDNGRILKPILKPSQRREVDFYNRVTTSSEPDLVELRGLIAKYFGCTFYTYNGHTQEYIVLEDLCGRMLEPCIMDVKIGRRTWDPLASPAKVSREQAKYALSKAQFAFSIPGYCVRRLRSGALRRCGKEHGKGLHSHAVVDAIRDFLNGPALRRALVVRLLSALWALQAWARRQSAVALWAASLLLVYDASRLRACCADVPCSAPRPPPRRRSIHSLHSIEGSPFSGQLSPKGPIYKKLNPVPLTSLTLAQSSFAPPPPANSPRSDPLAELHHNHSFDHNYEDNLSKIKMNYKATLDQLANDSPNPNPWATVKIIDFAHAFFNEEDDRKIDENFREGIDSLVEIFEGFLRETDDQII